MFDHKLQEFEVDPFLDDFPSVQISDLAFSNIIIKKKKNKKDFQWIFRFETTPKIICAFTCFGKFKCLLLLIVK